MIVIKEKSDCCGCTACFSICPHKAISMEADNQGFLYPNIDTKKCVNCGLCNKVCPISHRQQKKTENTTHEIYAARCKDSNILYNSSSGGMFSTIAKYILDCGGVVIGVAYNQKMEVVHCLSETESDCKKFRGSKYVQSYLGKTFSTIKQHLATGRLVLFSGTPCQVEGLNRFLLKPYNNLITIDLVCHAVASPLIFKNYVEYINNLAGEKLVDLNMRFKGGRGWGHRFSYLYTFESGRKEIDWGEVRDWGRLYFSHLISRPSCHNCKFCNFDRSADFTIADYWDDEKKHPEIYSKDGTSLVILNSEKAIKVFENLTTRILRWTISKEEAMQPCLQHSVVYDTKRVEKFWSFYLRNGFEKTYTKYFTSNLYNKRRRLLQKCKKIILKIFGK